jgi:ubiquinone/menaquinone biosynthesis C-methylase UbiE
MEMSGEKADVGSASGAHLEGVLDPQVVLEEMGVLPGAALLDVGSGAGRFSVPAAFIVGGQGKVYALDTSEERIASLRSSAQQRGLPQIEAIVADATERIPLPAGSVDVCLMANVFHDLAEDGAVKGDLSEVRRVLRPGGVLAIVDFKKDVPRPPGPPLSRRLDPTEVKRLVARYGLHPDRETEVGPYHYLILFTMPDTAPASRGTTAGEGRGGG